MSDGGRNLQVRRAVDAAAQRELICLVYGTPSVPLINGVVAIVTASVLWRIFPFRLSLVWLIVSLGVVLVRLSLWVQFRRHGAGSEDIRGWGRHFTFATAVTGCLWGLVASTTVVATEPIYYLFAAFVVGGLCAGAAIRLSPHPPALYAYIGTSAPPMVVTLMVHGRVISIAMGGLLLIFIVVMILVGRENYQRLADYIRLKIEQEVLNADLRRRESDLTTIAKLSDMLQSCRTINEAYPIVAEKAAALFPMANGAFFLASAESRNFERVSVWGVVPSCSLHRFQEEDCPAAREDRELESRGSGPGVACPHLAGAEGRSSLCVPVKVQERVRGVVSVTAAEGRRLEDATRQVLHSFTDVAKLSFANLQLRESLAEQAFRDPLTGLFNRRYLMETLPREIRRAQRRGAPLTIAMLDIDHFKRFNDTYGHDAGDLVLKGLAEQFGEALRAEDVACRYGGEEFLLLLPDCDLDPAYQRISDISAKARRRAYVLRGRSLPGTTVSAGLAVLSDTLSTSESLITAADKAMYAAKRMGRDRAECFQVSPPE